MTLSSRGWPFASSVGRTLGSPYSGYRGNNTIYPDESWKGSLRKYPYPSGASASVRRARSASPRRKTGKERAATQRQALQDILARIDHTQGDLQVLAENVAHWSKEAAALSAGLKEEAMLLELSRQAGKLATSEANQRDLHVYRSAALSPSGVAIRENDYLRNELRGMIRICKLLLERTPSPNDIDPSLTHRVAAATARDVAWSSAGGAPAGGSGSAGSRVAASISGSAGASSSRRVHFNQPSTAAAVAPAASAADRATDSVNARAPAVVTAEALLASARQAVAAGVGAASGSGGSGAGSGNASVSSSASVRSPYSPPSVSYAPPPPVMLSSSFVDPPRVKSPGSGSASASSGSVAASESASRQGSYGSSTYGSGGFNYDRAFQEQEAAKAAVAAEEAVAAAEAAEAAAAAHVAAAAAATAAAEAMAAFEVDARARGSGGSAASSDGYGRQMDIGGYVDQVQAAMDAADQAIADLTSGFTSDSGDGDDGADDGMLYEIQADVDADVAVNGVGGGRNMAVVSDGGAAAGPGASAPSFSGFLGREQQEAAEEAEAEEALDEITVAADSIPADDEEEEEVAAAEQQPWGAAKPLSPPQQPSYLQQPPPYSSTSFMPRQQQPQQQPQSQQQRFPRVPPLTEITSAASSRSARSPRSPAAATASTAASTPASQTRRAPRAAAAWEELLEEVEQEHQQQSQLQQQRRQQQQQQLVNAKEDAGQQEPVLGTPMGTPVKVAEGVPASSPATPVYQGASYAIGPYPAIGAAASGGFGLGRSVVQGVPVVTSTPATVRRMGPPPPPLQTPVSPVAASPPLPSMGLSTTTAPYYLGCSSNSGIAAAAAAAAAPYGSRASGTVQTTASPVAASAPAAAGETAAVPSAAVALDELLLAEVEKLKQVNRALAVTLQSYNRVTGRHTIGGGAAAVDGMFSSSFTDAGPPPTVSSFGAVKGSGDGSTAGARPSFSTVRGSGGGSGGSSAPPFASIANSAGAPAPATPLRYAVPAASPKPVSPSALWYPYGYKVVTDPPFPASPRAAQPPPPTPSSPSPLAQRPVPEWEAAPPPPTRMTATAAAAGSTAGGSVRSASGDRSVRSASGDGGASAGSDKDGVRQLDDSLDSQLYQIRRELRDIRHGLVLDRLKVLSASAAGGTPTSALAGASGAGGGVAAGASVPGRTAAAPYRTAGLAEPPLTSASAPTAAVAYVSSSAYPPPPATPLQYRAAPPPPPPPAPLPYSDALQVSRMKDEIADLRRQITNDKVWYMNSLDNVVTERTVMFQDMQRRLDRLMLWGV
ncbi:hypothetical protein Agub_g6615 [Astrephomene gubernaculifera]|uniref:Uncharacterized protein n=1 Tax=Astrephomene gubernaculifera TaxID=47775 RepID=A0AAD3DNQ8_9CHLO|nr:hypothetical protein Agub_g6615 [Astrephomene gubernaculifera]